MTDFAFKLPLRCQPIMNSATTPFTGYTLFHPMVSVVLFASSFIRKPIKKIQCIHAIFLANKHGDCAKLRRGGIIVMNQ